MEGDEELIDCLSIAEKGFETSEDECFDKAVSPQKPTQENSFRQRRSEMKSIMAADLKDN